MKVFFLFFSLFFISASAFAADCPVATTPSTDAVTGIEIPVDFLAKEVCYTATISGEVSIPVVGGLAGGVGLEVTGCGESAEEALTALAEGLARLVRLGILRN